MRMIGKKLQILTITGAVLFMSLYGCSKKEVSEGESNVQEVKKEVKLPEKMSASEYYNYGLEHIKKGGFDEAIAAWERALELEPTMTNAYEKLAKAYYTQGKFTKAGEIYRKELTLK